MFVKIFVVYHIKPLVVCYSSVVVGIAKKVYKHSPVSHNKAAKYYELGGSVDYRFSVLGAVQIKGAKCAVQVFQVFQVFFGCVQIIQILKSSCIEQKIKQSWVLFGVGAQSFQFFNITCLRFKKLLQIITRHAKIKKYILENFWLLIEGDLRIKKKTTQFLIYKQNWCNYTHNGVIIQKSFKKIKRSNCVTREKNHTKSRIKKMKWLCIPKKP
eukprot:TRINITY_DN1808_c0_g2_i10.p1 TRINITY_DN1808_c0_g2~~TRINITY_DN1808_c0_g2_i10.p1  ORF type:complete len:213 (+),score=-18.61 TRINITY_DN1808_c0_g2_i10:490-1128(+)